MRDFDGGFCKGFGWPCTHGSHAHGKKGGKALILQKHHCLCLLAQKSSFSQTPRHDFFNNGRC